MSKVVPALVVSAALLATHGVVQDTGKARAAGAQQASWRITDCKFAGRQLGIITLTDAYLVEVTVEYDEKHARRKAMTAKEWEISGLQFKSDVQVLSYTAKKGPTGKVVGGVLVLMTKISSNDLPKVSIRPKWETAWLTIPKARD